MDGFGIEGIWAASATINGVQICGLTNFESMKLVEQAGNQLPTFELIFRLSDPGVLSYLNEGNVLTLGMGVKQLDLSGVNVRPMSKDISKADSTSLRVIVNGFYDAIAYKNQTNTTAGAKMSALEQMQKVVSKYFNADFSPSSSNDSQNWSQPGQSDAEFVEHLWTHADLGTTDSPMVAITVSGDFRVRAMSAASNGSPNWVFDNTQVVGGNTVMFHQDWSIKSDTGFANFAAGYSQTSDIIDLDNGPGKLFNTTPSQFLGQSDSLEQSSSQEANASQNLIHNINTHDNFHQSHANNVTNLTNMSSTKIYLSNSDIYFPIKCLDTILFTESLDNSGSAQTISGQFIVTQVTRHLEDGVLHTMIDAVRESLNQTQISS